MTTLKLIAFSTAILLLTANMVVSQSDENGRKSGNGYVGAVVSYRAIWNPNMNDTINLFTNLEKYCSFIDDAAMFNTDLIVFPAEGLGSVEWSIVLPNINDSIDLTKQYGGDVSTNEQLLYLISKCAVRGDMYVVLTVNEQVIGDDYNKTCLTQIAINRVGKIVAKNQGGKCRNNTNIDEEIFEMENGLRIALMLNEDIYNQDRLERIKNLQIKNYALSYNLNGSLPFYTALQTEWSWSYMNNVVLLAASQTSDKFDGSGIFVGTAGNPIYMAESVNSLLIRTISPDFSQQTDGSHHLEYISGEKQLVKRSHATAVAWASAYAAINKREIKQQKQTINSDLLANYNKMAVSVNQTGYIDDNYLEFYNLNENLCSNGLCCTFKMVWKIRHADSSWYTDSFSSDDVDDDDDDDDDYDGDDTGCYALLVGNLTEDLDGTDGTADVQRCAITYLTDNKFCHQPANELQTTLPQNYYKILNRDNVILQHLEIVANVNGLTPNILLDNTFVKLPLYNMFNFNDKPTSSLIVDNKYGNFITYGLQHINNYKNF